MELFNFAQDRRRGIRDSYSALCSFLDYAPLHPGYSLSSFSEECQSALFLPTCRGGSVLGDSQRQPIPLFCQNIEEALCALRAPSCPRAKVAQRCDEFPHRKLLQIASLKGI